MLGCFWKKNVAKNPTFKLYTVSTQNDHARLAIDWAVALATGGKKPATTHFPSLVFENSTTGKPNPVECKPNLPGDIYLSAAAAGRRAGEAGEEVGTTRGLRAAVLGPPRAPRDRQIRIVVNEPTVSLQADTTVAPTRSRRCRCAGSPSTTTAIAALTDVSFEVLPGEVHALLGENGAGKSTLMNVASGATAPDGGTIVFDGSPVENLTPAVAQELGIAIVHQHPALLPDMTVAENIRVAVGREHLRRRDPDADEGDALAARRRPLRRPPRGPRLVPQRRPAGTCSSSRRRSPSRRGS